jgi:hypothetical protein
MNNPVNTQHMRNLLLLAPVLVFFLHSSSYAQCSLVDRSRDALFISYERLGDVGKRREKVARVIVLRLNNNTDCAVYITAGSAENFMKAPSENATVLERVRREIEYVLPDDALVPDVQYRFATPRGYVNSVGGDMFFDLKLLGKRSIMFEVPLEHLVGNETNELKVPFRYAWEHENRAKHYFLSVESTVNFGVGELPERIRERIRRN